MLVEIERAGGWDQAQVNFGEDIPFTARCTLLGPRQRELAIGENPGAQLAPAHRCHAGGNPGLESRDLGLPLSGHGTLTILLSISRPHSV